MDNKSLDHEIVKVIEDITEVSDESIKELSDGKGEGKDEQ